MLGTDQDLYPPVIRSFIPILYVAWADGRLSGSEVDLLKTRISANSQLTDREKNQLFQWVNPEIWPDEATFKSWLSLMKMASHDDETVSLSELGLRMATNGEGSTFDRNLLRKDLEKIEQDLSFPPLLRFRSLAASLGSFTQSSKFGIGGKLVTIIHGSHRELRAGLYEILQRPAFERRILRDKQVYRLKILEWLQLLSGRGYGSVGYPLEFGGKGDIIQYAEIFSVLSTFDLSLAVKFGVQFGLFGGSIQHLGTIPHHRKYLRAIGEGKLLGCFAMTETGHGSNVRDLETTAVYDPDTHEIDVHTPHEGASKEYIGNALHGSLATVFAQLIVQGENQGVHAILVPIRDESGMVKEGIRIEDNGYKLGLNGVDNGKIWFDHVKVPRENLLNRFGNITLLGRYESEIPNPSRRFFTMLGTLVAGRICVGKGAIAAAQTALKIAIDYGLHRRQFGPDHGPEMLIMDYPSHQHRLLLPLAKAYALHFAINDLVDRYQKRKEADLRELETQAAALKAEATWFANETIQTCREACGGRGYLWETRLADLRNDTDIFATFEGDNTVLMQLVAKGLLSRFQDSFNDAGFYAAIRYLSSQVSDTVLTLNPVYKRKTDIDHLLDPAFHTHAMQFRERKLLHSLGSRMRSMFRKRITPFDVFLRSQNHMINLAHAFSDGLVLNSFQQYISNLSDSPERDLLQKIYQLYALDTLEKNKGWYLEQDYFEYIKTKAIRHTIERLLTEIRPFAKSLIDGLGVPDWVTKVSE